VQISDLAEISRGVSREPIIVPLSSLEVVDEQIKAGNKTYVYDGQTRQKLAAYLKLPDRYLAKCPIELQATNLNYWSTEAGEGEVAIYAQGDQIVSLSDPNSRALPLTSYLDVIASNFSPSDEVTELITDGDYLHVDVVTDQNLTIPGTDSRGDEIVSVGLRVVAFPDAAKPPVTSTILQRPDGSIIAVPEVASKINLRGKDPDEIVKEFDAVITGLLVDAGDRLEQLRATTERGIVGSRAQFVYHVGHEYGLPQAVEARVMDLSSPLPDDTSLYDILSVFAQVADEDITYRSKLALQNLAGDFVAKTDQMLERCETCERPFPDFSKV